MANKDSAFGCKPVRMMGGAPYSGGQSRYRIASGATTPIFQGDLVTQLTAGVIGRHAASGTVPIVGVFNGVQYTDPTTGEQVFKNYYPGSVSASDIIASVIDDPNVVFEVQADDTSSGISNLELDVTTGATTATLPLKCIDISQDPDNDDVASSNTNVLCVIQNHIMGQKGAGLA